MKAGYSVKGRGKTVVLLHGSMATRAQWQMLVEMLHTDYRVITMDLSGYGNTPFPNDAGCYSLALESQLLAEILSDFVPDEERYHLVGHSYGGVVAMHHAYHDRSRVESLTVIEPMAYHLLENDHEHLRISRMIIAEISNDIAEGKSIAGAEKFIDLWMVPGTFSRLSEREKELLAEGVRKMVLDFKAASEEPLALEDYKLLPQPFSLIAGKQSPVHSLCITERIVEQLPHSTLYRVDGGHFSPVTHHYQVNPLIRNLLMQADGRKIVEEPVAESCLQH